jgi:PKD repeat protein
VNDTGAAKQLIVSFNCSSIVAWKNESAVFNAAEGCENYTWNFGDGNVTTVSVPLITHAYSSVGKYNVVLNATKHGLWNSTSSQITVTHDTDLNKDEKVNIEDAAAVAAAYGSTTGGSRWNPVADLDKNGWINIVDITMVAKDYGKTV